MPIKGVIVDVFDRWRCVNHEPRTVDLSLDFRGSVNENPTMRSASRSHSRAPVSCESRGGWGGEES